MSYFGGNNPSDGSSNGGNDPYDSDNNKENEEEYSEWGTYEPETPELFDDQGLGKNWEEKEEESGESFPKPEKADDGPKLIIDRERKEIKFNIGDKDIEEFANSLPWY